MVGQRHKFWGLPFVIALVNAGVAAITKAGDLEALVLYCSATCSSILVIRGALSVRIGAR